MLRSMEAMRFTKKQQIEVFFLLLGFLKFAAGQCPQITSSEVEAVLTQQLSLLGGEGGFNVAVHVNEFNINCLASASSRGYAQTTVVVNYTLATSPQTSLFAQLNVICTGTAWDEDHNSNQLITDQESDFGGGVSTAEELLVAEADLSCLRCHRQAAGDSPSHCLPCPEECSSGLMQCYGLGTCCNYYDMDDNCLDGCNSDLNMVADENYICTCQGYYGPPGHCNVCQLNCEHNGTMNSNCTQCECPQGYLGTMCETVVDNCDPQPCLNNGTCISDLANFTCLCLEGYTDKLCDVEINECDAEPCQNNATCIDELANFTCVCALGYSGSLCEVEINECDSLPCHNNGTCVDLVANFTCDCNYGYTGNFCETEINECESFPCQNGGTCIDDFANFTCECVPGYTGRFCEDEIDECQLQPCRNNATCVDGLANFTCLCAPGYTGVLCQEELNECDISPCQNNATCVDGLANFTCLCAPGYTGILCQEELNECDISPCQNNATCIDGLADFTCLCVPGYTGKMCQEEIDECDSAPCQNNATCIDRLADFTCLCAPGYTGILCQEELNECDSNPCENGATCVDGLADFVCLCAPGYTGNLCQEELNECDSNPCENNATCVDGLADFTCLCIPGYTGKVCQEGINDCESNPCQNNATCIDQVNDFICECFPDYTGSLCQTKVDDCASNPCLHGGTCADEVLGFSCSCVAHRTGSTCQECLDGLINLPSGGCGIDCDVLCQDEEGYEQVLCSFYCQLEFWSVQAVERGIPLPPIAARERKLSLAEQWQQAIEERDKLADIWRNESIHRGLTFDILSSGDSSNLQSDDLEQLWVERLAQAIMDHAMWQTSMKMFMPSFPVQQFSVDPDTLAAHGQPEMLYNELLEKWSIDLSNYLDIISDGN